MKPLLLEFQGINSFSEHTSIDFEALTKNGIFGIFGDTGSGKSTILDCINFALYGNVDRSKEKTDIINYRSNAAEVKFVFNILNEGKRKTYTVERSLKLSGTHKASLYEDDVCIADKASQVEKKIVEILGVEDEDFRKCIALPQGEFAQFVKSAPRDRLALIERLFSLSKYGDRLKEKLNSRQNEIEKEYQNISGRLSGYGQVSEAALEILKEQQKAGEKRLEEISKTAKLAAEKCEKYKNLIAKRNELEETQKLLNTLTAQKPEIENLRKELNSLPICREAVQTAAQSTKKFQEFLKLEDDYKSLVKSTQEDNKTIAFLEETLKNRAYDEKISECVKLSASYQTCEGKPERLKNILVQLDKKRAEYKKAEEEKAVLLQKCAAAEKEAEQAEKDLQSLGGNDLNHLINVQFKGAVLKEEYARNLDYFARLGGDIKSFDDGSALYNFVSGEVKNKVEEYKQRVLDVKDFGLDVVNGQLDKIRQNEEERDRRQNVLNEKKEALQKLKTALQLKESELQTAKKDGAEIRARADELDGELKAVFGENCTDYSAAKDKNARDLENLKAEQKQFISGLEILKNERNENNISIERLNTLITTAKLESNNLGKKLTELLEKGGFDSAESCKKLVERFANYPDAEKSLTDFDNRFAAVSAKFAELKNTADINGVSDADFAKAEKERSELESEVNALTGSIAVMKAECESAVRRLEEKKAISKELGNIVSGRELIARLKEVTKNNKFLEYIANEYLQDISALASSTLLKLTDGRYFLTYKDNNFFVADNFDCGNLRGVNTLSGGETFLVSLSLALALSQTICAKSLKTIEFFFLDEGFGTLDSTLIETVMSALEKLKNSHFTIGIISHVEELKNTIPFKITVKKATETHGSTVQLSC